MGLDEFRAWIESQIDRLSTVPAAEWSDLDYQQGKELIADAYERAISLRLPQAEILSERKPVRILLCELLDALPAPGYLTRDQLAALLKCNVRTISRRVYQGSLPEPTRVGRLSRFSVKELREYGINL